MYLSVPLLFKSLFYLFCSDLCYFFLMITLCLICSFPNILRYKGRLFKIFLCLNVIIHLSLRTAFLLSYKFWYVLFPFMFVLRFFFEFWFDFHLPFFLKKFFLFSLLLLFAYRKHFIRSHNHYIEKNCSMEYHPASNLIDLGNN